MVRERPPVEGLLRADRKPLSGHARPRLPHHLPPADDHGEF
ncbi:hypothetical protein PSMK_08200 [Phycisphaera mikurensis NBRC 102666]|uniref:Uncharacterized protein n=1 Tax=Phycisphaera mikurensis (strain NBRC 102666 / KCTC 22515 / FYK2301M01) TaxID=1142394 RepID=I0ICJ1_PHYMF|nr:hypothetical protein PSMK_08200 [Phycisphaera mikurensis NBRC 102666]